MFNNILLFLILLFYIDTSSAECMKVVSDIFGEIEVFDGISKYGVYTHILHYFQNS